MMDMQSPSIEELAKALNKVQARVMGARKDKINGHFHKGYADLESVWEACREPLIENGFSVAQPTAYVEGAGTCVVTTLMHVSGQWLRGVLPVSADKADPQGQGSAITYARRFGFAAMVGVYQVDDDGEAGMGRGGDTPPAASPTPESPRQPSPQAPMQAQGADGGSGDVSVPYGNNKGKLIRALTIDECRRDIEYWMKRAEKDGKPLAGAAKLYVDALRMWVQANPTA